MRVVVRSNAAPLCGESLTPSQGLVDVRDYQFFILFFLLFFEGGAIGKKGCLGFLVSCLHYDRCQSVTA